VETFATGDAEANWTARDIDYRPDETLFSVNRDGVPYDHFRTPLAGLFNVRNCLGAIAAAETLGFSALRHRKPSRHSRASNAAWKSVHRR
jgi:UDP-N-acetylmuramyl tripeptide synthase